MCLFLPSGLRIILSGRSSLDTPATTLFLTTIKSMETGPVTRKRSLRKDIRAFSAMFVQDCGADANPLPRRSVELAEHYGETIATAVDQVLHAKMRAVKGPITAAFVSVDLPFQKPPSREELESRTHEKTLYFSGTPG